MCVNRSMPIELYQSVRRFVVENAVWKALGEEKSAG